MNRLSRFPLSACFFCLFTLALPGAAGAQAAPPPASTAAAIIGGVYQGTITVPGGVVLTIRFTIGGTPTKPNATLEVPEQTAQKISVETTTISGDTVTFALPNIGATFKGSPGVDNQTITGTFTQSGSDFPLVLTRTTKSPTLERSQALKPPFPYRDISVSYPNPKAKGVTLAGTLTVPDGAGNFPVVLLITGSGAQDRDETILGHKPFALLADYLARRKIASLRVDDRGTAKSTGNFATATTDDFAEDARAGIAFLRDRSEVDAKRIGIIGHSEGGVIAPMVAASDPDIAFVVLLAGTGVSGNAVMDAQQRAIMSRMGLSDAAIESQQVVIKSGMTAIRNSRDGADARVQVDKAIKERVNTLPEATRETAQKQLKAAFYPWCNDWFIRFLSLNPETYLRQVRCPVLAVNGSRDVQVVAAQNLPAIEAALKAGGNTFSSVKELPGLNHLFQTAKTGLPAEYGTIPETMSPLALRTVGDWIVAHTKP